MAIIFIFSFTFDSSPISLLLINISLFLIRNILDVAFANKPTQLQLYWKIKIGIMITSSYKLAIDEK